MLYSMEYKFIPERGPILYRQSGEGGEKVDSKLAWGPGRVSLFLLHNCVTPVPCRRVLTSNLTVISTVCGIVGTWSSRSTLRNLNPSGEKHTIYLREDVRFTAQLLA